MALVYYYINKNNYSLINEGIELWKNYDEKIILEGEIVPCIKTLLTPKDEILKYKTKEFVCIKVDVDIESCYVINNDLSILPDKTEYYKSKVLLKDYRFGTYRNPRVLILKDVAPRNIKVYSEYLEDGIIFENSNDLYKNNVFEEFKHIYGDFAETMLAVFFMLMSSKGKFELLGKKILENKKTLYIYKDKKTKRIYSISVKEGQKNE